MRPAPDFVSREVIAPFSGVVSAKNVEPGAFSSPGARVFRLVKLHPLKVRLDVTESTRAGLSKKTKVRVIETGGARVDREARVSVVSPAAERATGLFKVLLEIDNDDGKLVSGQSLVVELSLASQEEVYLVKPEWVVYRHDGLALVFVEEGRARSIRLRKDLVRDSQYLVVPQKELPSLPLVVEGQHFARDGEPVEVSSQKEGAGPPEAKRTSKGS